MGSLGYFVVFILLNGLHGFQWSPDLPDNVILYRCAGDDAELLWKYQTSTGDVIHDIQWLQEGHSHQLIGILSHGTFVALPAFSNRVHYVPNAGIVLSGIVPGDSGNYTVEISGGNSMGTLVTYRRTVTLVVTRNNTLLTNDGQLHATMEPQPVYSDNTGHWSLVLSCGTFTYLKNPPFIVEWRTPSGALVPSTSYENGHFKLHVQEGGSYTCTIADHDSVDACLSTPPEASIDVDRTGARLTLLESRQKQLEDKNKLLEDKNALLQSLQNNMTFVTSHVTVMEARLDSKDSQLTHALQALTDKVAHQVGFHGQLRSDGVFSARLPFTEITVNYGSGLSGSGTFTAPVSGLYFLLATVTPRSGSPTTAHMKMDGTVICHVDVGVSSQSVTCATVQQLRSGSQVWMETTMDLYQYGTHFTGFLISAD